MNRSDEDISLFGTAGAGAGAAGGTSGSGGTGGSSSIVTGPLPLYDEYHQQQYKQQEHQQQQYEQQQQQQPQQQRESIRSPMQRHRDEQRLSWHFDDIRKTQHDALMTTSVPVSHIVRKSRSMSPRRKRRNFDEDQEEHEQQQQRGGGGKDTSSSRRRSRRREKSVDSAFDKYYNSTQQQATATNTTKKSLSLFRETFGKSRAFSARKVQKQQHIQQQHPQQYHQQRRRRLGEVSGEIDSSNSKSSSSSSPSFYSSSPSSSSSQYPRTNDHDNNNGNDANQGEKSSSSTSGGYVGSRDTGGGGRGHVQQPRLQSWNEVEMVRFDKAISTTKKVRLEFETDMPEEIRGQEHAKTSITSSIMKQQEQLQQRTQQHLDLDEEQGRLVSTIRGKIEEKEEEEMMKSEKGEQGRKSLGQDNTGGYQGHHSHPGDREKSKSQARRKKKTSSKEAKAIEVDFYNNPTILSRLVLNQKYDQALWRLQTHPEEATVWVCAKRKERKKTMKSCHGKKDHDDAVMTSHDNNDDDAIESHLRTRGIRRNISSSMTTMESITAKLAQLPRHQEEQHLSDNIDGQGEDFPLNDPARKSKRPRQGPGLGSTDTPATKHSDDAFSIRQLPLHIACVNLCRALDVQMRATLNDLITNLIVSYPHACRQPDHRDVLPIHEAIWNGAAPETVSMLLMAYPESLHSRDPKGRTLSELNRHGPITIDMHHTDNRTNHRKQVQDVLDLDVKFWQETRMEAKREEYISDVYKTKTHAIESDEIHPIAWEQLEERAIAAEQILCEVNETNFILSKRIESLTQSKIRLVDKFERMKNSDLLHEARTIKHENQKLRALISRMERLLRDAITTNSKRKGHESDSISTSAGESSKQSRDSFEGIHGEKVVPEIPAHERSDDLPSPSHSGLKLVRENKRLRHQLDELNTSYHKQRARLHRLETAIEVILKLQKDMQQGLDQGRHPERMIPEENDEVFRGVERNGSHVSSISGLTSAGLPLSEREFAEESMRPLEKDTKYEEVELKEESTPSSLETTIGILEVSSRRDRGDSLMDYSEKSGRNSDSIELNRARMQCSNVDAPAQDRGDSLIDYPSKEFDSHGSIKIRDMPQKEKTNEFEWKPPLPLTADVTGIHHLFDDDGMHIFHHTMDTAGWEQQSINAPSHGGCQYGNFFQHPVLIDANRGRDLQEVPSTSDLEEVLSTSQHDLRIPALLGPQEPSTSDLLPTLTAVAFFQTGFVIETLSI